jgi:hypothetical protein
MCYTWLEKSAFEGERPKFVLIPEYRAMYFRKYEEFSSLCLFFLKTKNTFVDMEFSQTNGLFCKRDIFLQKKEAFL